ncbi:amidase [Aquicella lusitana]|uniref:Amidase n=1 Tax=Aquicella lusitana TaxID=254246 RepID=A0A370GYB3_9COXI|nr:amidase [Aquicella lusitana]RDI48638.1 amidase [Aquicella lusitana]VVC73985.1 Glutamyl-tRNA(Gln) amidotransferase subunit A [Aquicella lusitana]
MQVYDFESSYAFMKPFQIQPYQSGRLDGLSFAVKDLIDIAGEITGFGNPSWAETHPKAVINAVCVDQLLSEGAACRGKTVSDELAYSLIGENPFYGTPVNPKAPDRVPGGSSSGSASAVACSLVDFALGTDTGGSVRVPASNCGIWGYRPSHGRISVAGVSAFAPSFDTIGVLAREGKQLEKVIAILTGMPITQETVSTSIFLLEDIFAICDPEVQQALLPAVERLQAKFSVKRISLQKIAGLPLDFNWLLETYVLLQSTEIWSCLGSWIEGAQPVLGEIAENNFTELAKGADRLTIQRFVEKREKFAAELNTFLSSGNLLCFPTVPALPPKRGTITKHARAGGIYYPRALAIGAISGLSRAPQISIPLGESNGIPVGLSLLAAYGQDSLLAAMSCRI